MRLYRAGFVLAASLVLAILPPRSTQAQSGPAPILAYYYAWWSPQAVGPGKSPDWPVTPYHSWDAGIIQQHVAQAASAGIDGLVVAWYGPQEENNQTETNFRMILDQAAANGITALLSVDLGSAAWFSSTQAVIDGLNYALSVHAQHPAYFRYNGKPVLFFWFQGRYSMSDWATIRQQMDPDHQSIWIAEGAALDALPTFDGLHLYTVSWADNVYGTLSQWGNSTRNAGGLWVATAMPGWDNTYTQQSERYVRERQDGAFYRDTFAAAAASAPNMILITSWNEWWEGSQIEPSQNYGDFYLNLTRDLISEYKASGGVAAGGSSGPPIQATPPPAMTQAAPGDVTTPIPTALAPRTMTAVATSTLPPTITPTMNISTTPTALIASTQIAEVRPSVEVGEPENRAEARILGDRRSRLIAGIGALAVLGLGLVSAAGAAYLRGRADGRKVIPR